MPQSYARHRIWAVIGGCALIFLLIGITLGLLSEGENTHSFDETITSRLQQWQGAIPEALYHTGDMLGGTVMAVAIAGAGIVIALVKGDRKVAIFLIVAVLLRLAGTQLKPLFDSPRPVGSGAQVRIFETFEGTGYPSGHSMTVATIAMTSILLTWYLTTRADVRIVIAGVAGVGMLLVGWSRIWSGAHWATDVLGGWSFGIALVLIAWIVAASLEERSEPTPSAPAGIAADSRR